MARYKARIKDRLANLEERIRPPEEHASVLEQIERAERIVRERFDRIRAEQRRQELWETKRAESATPLPSGAIHDASEEITCTVSVNPLEMNKPSRMGADMGASVCKEKAIRSYKQRLGKSVR